MHTETLVQTHLDHTQYTQRPRRRPLETQRQKGGVCRPPTSTAAQSAVGTMREQQHVKLQRYTLFDVPRCVFPNLPLNGARLKGWVGTFPLHGFAAVKATDNNKRFTRSGNWKKSGGEAERQYFSAVKEWRWLQQAKSLPLCPRGFDPQLPEVGCVCSYWWILRLAIMCRLQTESVVFAQRLVYLKGPEKIAPKIRG